MAGSSAQGPPAHVPLCCAAGPPRSVVPCYLAWHSLLPPQAHLPASPSAPRSQVTRKDDTDGWPTSLPDHRQQPDRAAQGEGRHQGVQFRGSWGAAGKLGRARALDNHWAQSPSAPPLTPRQPSGDQTLPLRPSVLQHSCPHSPETPDEVREGPRPGTGAHPRGPHTARLNLTGDQRPRVNHQALFLAHRKGQILRRTPFLGGGARALFPHRARWQRPSRAVSGSSSFYGQISLSQMLVTETAPCNHGQRDVRGPPWPPTRHGAPCLLSRGVEWRALALHRQVDGTDAVGERGSQEGAERGPRKGPKGAQQVQGGQWLLGPRFLLL